MSQKDDLEAVRNVVAALDGFTPDEQERIIRWAREKVNLPVAAQVAAPTAPSGAATPAAVAPSLPVVSQGTGKDLKTFVDEKKPKNDVQFAATVAYYYRFELPTDKRKTEVTSDDLQEACRLAKRERFKNPGQTLRNAHTLGLLDKGSSSGAYTINSVGENLVAMTLPSDGKVRAASKGKAKKASKKAASKPQRKQRAGKK